MDASFWSGKRVLVTGAAGFVGRWLVRAIATTDARLLITDRTAPDPIRLLIERPTAHIDSGALDLCDRAETRNLILGMRPEVIVHLAGQAGVGASLDDPAGAFDANVGATLSVLEAARELHANDPDTLGSLVVTSSNHVYGHQNTEPTNETAPLNGRGVYAATKLCADVLAQTWAFEYGLPASVARITNSFGGDDPHASHLVTATIRSVLRGERPLIKGSGRDTKGFAHIDDTVEGILRLAERTARDPSLGGLAFNIVPDEPVSVLALVKLIAETAGRPDLEPEILGDGGSDEHEHLDNKLARGLLGWRPAYTLESGIEEALTWYRSRPAAA